MTTANDNPYPPDDIVARLPPHELSRALAATDTFMASRSFLRTMAVTSPDIAAVLRAAFLAGYLASRIDYRPALVHEGRS